MIRGTTSTRATRADDVAGRAAIRAREQSSEIQPRQIWLMLRATQDMLGATSLIGHGVSGGLAASMAKAQALGYGPDEILAILRRVSSDAARANSIDESSTKLRRAGVANLNSNVLLIGVLILIIIGVSIGQSELPDNMQTITVDLVANLGLALAVADHIKRNK